MKKTFGFLCICLLVFGPFAVAYAVPITFTYTSDNVVSAWFKDGAAPVEITASATNHDVWQNATTNTIDLGFGHQWEMIWLNANSDHDSGWRVPGSGNPGGFLGQVTSETGLLLTDDTITHKILTGTAYWEVAFVEDFFNLNYNGTNWGTDDKSKPDLATLQGIYDERPGSNLAGVGWEDLNWVAASQYGANSDPTNIWGAVAGIDGDAQWIWTDANFGETGAPDIDDAVFVRVKFEPVPEPATLLMVGAGLVGLAGLGRRRFKRR